MDDSLRVELEVQRHLATLQICHQAEALYGVGAVQQWRAQPLPQIAGPLWQAFDKSRWPLELVQRYRPSHQHGLGTMAALDLAMTISLDGPESELIVDPRVSALRRLAKTGVWAGHRPLFIGRLDSECGPDKYVPTPELVQHLCAQQAWHEASEVALGLRGRAKSEARLHVLDQREQFGLRVKDDALTAELKDGLWARRAKVAAQRRDLDAASECWATIRAPRTAAMAAIEVSRVAHDRGDHEIARGWLELAQQGAPQGDWYLEAIEQNSPLLRRGTEQWLRHCAIGARRDRNFWAHGRRPDLRLAKIGLRMTVAAHLGPTGTPAMRNRQVGLDDLDVALEMVQKIGVGTILGSEGLKALRITRLKERLQQAAWAFRYRAAANLDLQHPSMKRPEVTAFVRGLLGDEAFKAQLSQDPSDTVRAFYDDGLARSPVARRHRHALVRASKQVLRSTRIDTEPSPTYQVTEVRIATLAELSGAKASSALREHVQETAPRSAHRDSVLAAWAQVQGRGLVEAMMQEALRYGNDRQGGALRGLLESKGQLPAGFARATNLLFCHMRRRCLRDPDAWWAALCKASWRRHKQPPSCLSLSHLTEHGRLQDDISAEHVLDGFERRRQAVHKLSLEDWIQQAVSDHEMLDLALAWGQAESRGAWSADQWRTLFHRAQCDTSGRPVPDMVREWSRTLATSSPQTVARRLIEGSPPLLDLRAPVPIPGTQYQLRYLGKVTEAFRFLRFADCVGCCFQSTPRSYRGYGTINHIIRLWRDPMNFCFHVEHEREPVRPVGFVFGGYGECTPGGQGLLLNGLYLKRQQPGLRSEILSTIEARLARPLGLRWMALANRNGGYGKMPERYERKTRMTERFRALRHPRVGLHTHTYDDIGRRVNKCVPTTLYWAPL